ncbi:unnamed protein product, partial [Ixodes pacificus]
EKVEYYCRLPFCLKFRQMRCAVPLSATKNPRYTRAQTKIPVLKSSLESGV